MSVIVFPLFNKVNPTLAYQRRPKVAANQGLVRIPTMPWDDGDRPPVVGYGQVESDPTLWDITPFNFGLSAIGIQSVRLVDLKTNPRAAKISEQNFEPAVVHPLVINSVTPKIIPIKPINTNLALIWPIQQKLFNVVFLQTRPKWTAGRPIPIKVLNRPWRRTGNGDNLPSSTIPTIIHQLIPKAIVYFKISGVTKDSNGNPLGTCVVNLFRTSDNQFMQTTTSDASGNYTFYGMGQQDHFEVSYKTGSPDVAGTTLNTLRGA